MLCKKLITCEQLQKLYSEKSIFYFDSAAILLFSITFTKSSDKKKDCWMINNLSIQQSLHFGSIIILFI